MDLVQFKKSSLDQISDVYLQSLWYDYHDDWERSHLLIQDVETKEAAMIHAYLHRKEGDIWNADYWYRRAGTRKRDITLENEWEELVVEFLGM